MSTSGKRSASLDVEIGGEEMPVVVYFNITPPREEIKFGPNAAPYEDMEVDLTQVMLVTNQRLYDILDILSDVAYDKLNQECWVAVKEGKV